jgi:pimeloyl-ACP methyl ester carboxylesterase
VLAGHSFGGLYTLSFAARYPDEVLGMVLLDSTAPQPATTPAKPAAPGSYDVMSHLAAVVATVGEVGLSKLYAHVEAGTLPPRSRDDIRASIAKADTVESTIDETVQANTALERTTPSLVPYMRTWSPRRRMPPRAPRQSWACSQRFGGTHRWPRSQRRCLRLLPVTACYTC